MQVRVLNHIAVTVSNTQRSLDFYVGMLGLEQVEQHQLPMSSIDAVFGLTRASGTSTRLQVPGQPAILIDLMELSGAEEGTSVQPLGSIGSTHMAFTVDNLDEVVTELKAKGVSFISDPVTFHLTEGSVTVVFMRDPDGNYVELEEVHA
jgi:glyoxylase I family protein